MAGQLDSLLTLDILFPIWLANVNDRSQLGDRDSEVAIIVDDKELVSYTIL